MASWEVGRIWTAFSGLIAALFSLKVRGGKLEKKEELKSEDGTMSNGGELTKTDHTPHVCGDSASRGASNPDGTSLLEPPVKNEPVTLACGALMEKNEAEKSIRCQVCNKEYPSASFVGLRCAHRFCSSCASMIDCTQLCPLCISEFASGVAGDDLPNASNLFSDSHQSVTTMSSDPTFSIWDPLTPKSLNIHETSKSSELSLSVPSQLLSTPHFTVNANAEGAQSSSVSSATSTIGSFFGIPPPASLRWQPIANHGVHNRFEHGLPECSMCGEENTTATVRCIQCKETLCNECVQAHYRVRVTRDHELVRIEPSYLGLCKPETIAGREAVKFDELSESDTCVAHDGGIICACVTCGNLALCAVCVAEHPKHQFAPVGDLRTALPNLVTCCRQNHKSLEDAGETIRRMCERVEASVQAAVRELRSMIHMHISALEERKRDLLQRVDIIRQSKIGSLNAQNDRISQRRDAFAEAVKAAMIAMSSTENCEAQRRAAFDVLVGLLREPKLHLSPCETDLVKFVLPDNSLLNKLRNVGELESGSCARTSHLVGEGFKRAIRDRMCSVAVQTRDACGDVCTASNPALSATFCAPDGQPLQMHISDRESGIYLLNYYPIEEGTHTLDVMIRGVSISGCPTAVQVRKGRDYGSLARSGPLFSFGGEGTEDGQLCRPWGICCDSKSRIIVADRSNNRIQVFDKDGNFLFKFGSSGSRPGQFNRPAGVAVNSMNEIIVTDKDNHRVQVFGENGAYLLKFGERGRTPGCFNYPWGVAVNSFNQIAISDTRNHRVQIFSQTGQFIRKCGFDTSLFYKNLDSPRGVCYLSDAQLVVTDFNNHRLTLISLRSSSDLKCYGGEGSGEGCFCRPQGIAVDNEGHILICDSRNNRIQVLHTEDMSTVASFGGMGGSPPATQKAPSAASSGVSVMSSISPLSPLSTTTLSSGSSCGSSTSSPNVSCELSSGCLDRPTDVCVSPEGLIYVVDFGGNCIRVY